MFIESQILTQEITNRPNGPLQDVTIEEYIKEMETKYHWRRVSVECKMGYDEYMHYKITFETPCYWI